jgi:hypothetical protein
MSADRILKSLVESYEAARRELQLFDRAMQERDTKEAARHLGTAAAAICAGLTAADDDPEFWAEMANLLKGATAQSLKETLETLDKVVEDEEEVLQRGGFSRSAISELLGDLTVTLGAFKEYPSGATLELVRRRVGEARRVMCRLSERGVKIERGFWGRSFRLVKASIKVLGGVAGIAVDLTTTPFSAPLAVASVAGGVDLLLSVGDVFRD